jgi:hypothetical protein
VVQLLHRGLSVTLGVGFGQLCRQYLHLDLGSSGCFLKLCLQGSILRLKIRELLFGCFGPQQSGC